MEDRKSRDNGPRMAPHSVQSIRDRRRTRAPLSADQIMDMAFLALSGCLAAVLAWLFWHFAAEAALPLLTASISLAVAVDNWRLRRQIRAMRKQGRDGPAGKFTP